MTNADIKQLKYAEAFDINPNLTHFFVSQHVLNKYVLISSGRKDCDYEKSPCAVLLNNR